ncbi:hypothetical protein AVEN_44966-1 [Araneus ventricosus]|uniref:Uncharacterized protein n=1 Tax=Araneus ventricosus TaxID=182803 RepID=A0A4Y2VE10_ARAVE|nr:hypothetical protein AVEN_44966-1 [Araneus ventricosus]
MLARITRSHSHQLKRNHPLRKPSLILITRKHNTPPGNSMIPSAAVARDGVIRRRRISGRDSKLSAGLCRTKCKHSGGAHLRDVIGHLIHWAKTFQVQKNVHIYLG